MLLLQGTVDESPIKHTVKSPSAELLGTFGRIPIKRYSKPAVPGLQSVTVEPLKIYESNCLQANSVRLCMDARISAEPIPLSTIEWFPGNSGKD